MPMVSGSEVCAHRMLFLLMGTVMNTFRILYFDCELDLDVDIYNVSKQLGIDIIFAVLGKGVGANLKNRWRPMPLVGKVYEVQDDNEQEKQLELLIRELSPKLLWVRSLSTNPEVVTSLSAKYGIPVVAWCTEQGASREGMSKAVRGFPYVIVNNLADLEFYSSYHEKVFYMPYCADTSFFRKVEPSGKFRAELGSYGNPYYNTARTALGMGGEKKFSVDTLVKPAIDARYCVKLWGNSGGKSPERGWLQVPYVAKNPITRLMSYYPVDRRLFWAVAKRVHALGPFYGSRFAKIGSAYQGPFEWKDYAAVNSSIKVFANVDHNFKFYRTYSPKLVRAMACGTAVLHMHTSGIEEDFVNHKHLIWSDGYENTRELLHYYLDTKNKEKLNRIGENAMQMVSEKYDLSKWLPKILDEIKQILKIN